MMTEKKAADTWCPMVRHMSEAKHQGTFNRSRTEGREVNRRDAGDAEFICNCIGSRCAMWRWGEAPLFRRYSVASAGHEQATEEPPVRTPGTPMSWGFVPYDEAEGEPAGWIEPPAEAAARRQGYCGLAGKPHN